MQSTKTTYKNSFLLSLISKGILSLSGIISLWIITYYSTIEDVGQYALAFMILNIFYIFGRFGLPELLIYESTIKKEKEKKKLLKNILGIAFVTSSISMIGLFLLSDILSNFLNTDISEWLTLVMIILPFMVIVDIFTKWYQSEQDIKSALVPSNIFRPILFMLFLGIFFKYTSFSNMISIVLSFFFSYFLVAIYYLYNIKSVLQDYSIDFNFIKQLNLQHAYNNVFTLFLVAFILSIDSFMVSYFYTDVEVAIYQVAIKIIMIATIFNMIIEPIFVSRIIHNKKENNIIDIENEHKKISYFGILYWIVVFIIFALFGNIIFSSFGSYTQSLEIFFIFMLGRIFDLTFGLSASVLNTYGYSKILLQNTVLLLCINFILNYLFIKTIGFTGVAYATALVFVIQAILRSYQLNKFIKINLYRLYIAVIPIVTFNLYYVNRTF
jgi:O-antigen/teichoic acid export membrane protein